jgi:hypothetical protein
MNIATTLEKILLVVHHENNKQGGTGNCRKSNIANST